jgi:3-isopropylmalate/(R)-2-methylmalate dehydratase small subunit
MQGDFCDMKNEHKIMEGIAAAIPIDNLDTDQIMPKQFLRGIDKSGLDKGVLYDLRHDANGEPRPDFILNRPEYAQASILIAGPNFGCGSSREHAVWGLMQFGIKAVIAPSFGEIFYSNAINNGLLLAMPPEEEWQVLMDEVASADKPLHLCIDVENLTVTSPSMAIPFRLSRRHQGMFLDGVDMLGATLAHLDAIRVFAQRWHEQHPWLKDVAQTAHGRLYTAASNKE